MLASHPSPFACGLIEVNCPACGRTPEFGCFDAMPLSDIWLSVLRRLADERRRTVADAPVWLTVKQAAARAQVGPKTIYRSVAAGRLRAARIGGRRDLRFLAEWVDDWLIAASTPVAVTPLRVAR